jgi:hypothetical protein
MTQTNRTVCLSLSYTGKVIVCEGLVKNQLSLECEIAD